MFVSSFSETKFIQNYAKVMEDNQEIGAFMFRRTVPAVHLTSEDVRWMVSQQIVHLSTG